MKNEIIQVKVLESAKDWSDYLSFSADLLAPIVAALFGIWILRITKRIEHSQWRNQKLIEKRIDLWDKIGPVTNDIYCYCMRIGSWKEFTPQEIVSKKREADKLMYLNTPFFSYHLLAKYEDLINYCFDTYQGHGEDAKIKSPVWEHKNVRDDWDDNWDSKFTDTKDNEKPLQTKYDSLLKQVRAEFTNGE